MFVGCLLAPPAGYGESYGLYASPRCSRASGGYQTMDAIAALNFGIIIAMNINNRGVTERSAVVKEITYAGWIAGLIFLVVYGAIAHVGAVGRRRLRRTGRRHCRSDCHHPGSVQATPALSCWDSSSCWPV